MKKRDCDSVYIAGDVVTVIDPDVGQGWCQATCSDGREGVVPEVDSSAFDYLCDCELLECLVY